MKRIFALCLVLLSGCFELSLPGVPAAPGSGSLQGTIVHAEPGQTTLRPANGATVELVGTGVKTRTIGDTAAFNLTPVDTAEGTVLIRFDSDGDGRADKEKLLRLEGLGTGRGKTVSLGQVVIGSTGAIRGKALRADLSGPTGHGGTSIFIPEGPYFGFTGDDGSFLLENLPEGQLTVALFRVGYLALAESVELRAGEIFPVRALTLKPDPTSPRAELKGRVLLPDGAGAAQVAVSLSSGRVTSTDAEGRYSFSAVPYEVYSIGFVKPEFLTAELLNILVASPVVTLRDVTLAPGMSTLPVLDAGRPIFDAGVSVDAGPVDAGVFDAGVDAGFDAGVDAGFDAGVDAGFDAGVDAGFDAGLDAGFDAGLDAGTDAGALDAGPPPDAVIDAPLFVPPNTIFTLSGTRSTGNRPLTYTWSQDAGPTIAIPNNGSQLAATPMIRSPVTPTLLKFTLVVADPASRTGAPASVLIPVAIPPVAVIDAGFSSVAYAGQRVVLNGAGSSDPNGAGIVTWDWVVNPPSITATPLNGGRVALDMPAAVGTSVVVTAGLTVVNGLTLRSPPVSASFTLTNAAAPTWTLDAGPSQTVGSGSVVTLRGLASSPVPGTTFTYAWSPDREPDGGVADWLLTDPTATTTTFVAPKVEGPTPRLINFTLTATETSGVLMPSVRSSPTVVSVIDRRPPQVVSTSVVAGAQGIMGGFVLFDEDIDPSSLNGITLTPATGSPPSNITVRTANGPRVTFSMRPPPTPGFMYTLTVAGVDDLAPLPKNLMVPIAPLQFFPEVRWSPAWESSSTSTGEPWPGLVVRRPSPMQPLQAFVFGRRDSNAWFAAPFDPFSCTTPPCVIADDASAPTVALSGPRARGKKGVLWNGKPIAMLQHADPQGTSPAAFIYDTSWQPLPAPPGPVFTVSQATPLYSAYADDGGLKLAGLDGGVWTYQSTISTDTVEYSVGPTSDPLLSPSAPTAPGFYVMARSSTSGSARVFFSSNGNAWSAGSSFVSGGGDRVTDVRGLLFGGNSGVGLVLRQSGLLQGFCEGAGTCGLNQWLPTVGTFDAVAGAPSAFIVAATGGVLELYLGPGASVRMPGPIRNGMPSTMLNNNPACFADRPELFITEGLLFVTWQERCAPGPWRVYLRALE